MAMWLKQSTAVTVVAGPFVSTTDAYTAKTALSLTQGKSLLWKQGGTSFAAKNESTTATHRSNGNYTVLLDATDTNTLGQLILSIDDSANAAFPVRHDYLVLPANIYDSLVLGTDYLQADTYQLNGSTSSASGMQKLASTIVTGTSDNTGFTATTTIFEASDVTEATSDHYKGLVVKFTSGALLGQASLITAYSLSSGRGRFTVNALTEAVPNGTTFTVG